MGSGDLAGLPETAWRWATAAAPEEVVAITRVGGGITNTKWVLVLSSGARLVMRWADPVRWGSLGREHVRREVLACQLLVESGLPVPVLIASDPDGIVAGGPANLLTWRPGRSRLDWLSGYAIDALAQAAVAIHQVAVPRGDRPATFTLRGLDAPQVPSWTSRPELWRRAIEVVHGDVPTAAHGLLHRDFHLGNTLWEEDEVTGLIDWAETSWGPPDVDVAHMCSDFAMMHGPAAADRFRLAYLSSGGRLDDSDACRFWIISDVLGFLPDPAHILPAVSPSRPDLSARLVRERLEALLAESLDR